MPFGKLCGRLGAVGREEAAGEFQVVSGRAGIEADQRLLVSGRLRGGNGTVGDRNVDDRGVIGRLSGGIPFENDGGEIVPPGGVVALVVDAVQGAIIDAHGVVRRPEIERAPRRYGRILHRDIHAHAVADIDPVIGDPLQHDAIHPQYGAGDSAVHLNAAFGLFAARDRQIFQRKRDVRLIDAQHPARARGDRMPAAVDHDRPPDKDRLIERNIRRKQNIIGVAFAVADLALGREECLPFFRRTDRDLLRPLRREVLRQADGSALPGEKASDRVRLSERKACALLGVRGIEKRDSAALLDLQPSADKIKIFDRSVFVIARRADRRDRDQLGASVVFDAAVRIVDRQRTAVRPEKHRMRSRRGIDDIRSDLLSGVDPGARSDIADREGQIAVQIGIEILCGLGDLPEEMRIFDRRPPVVKKKLVLFAVPEDVALGTRREFIDVIAVFRDGAQNVVHGFRLFGRRRGGERKIESAQKLGIRAFIGAPGDLREGRDQDGGEDGDDRDHDHKLHDRERRPSPVSLFVFSHGALLTA